MAKSKGGKSPIKKTSSKGKSKSANTAAFSLGGIRKRKLVDDPTLLRVFGC